MVIRPYKHRADVQGSSVGFSNMYLGVLTMKRKHNIYTCRK